MITAIIFKSFKAIVILGFAGVMNAAFAQSSCNTRQPEFVQISSMQLDAGKQVFEDFRIQSTNEIEWVRRDSNGTLLDHGVQRDINKRYYEKVMALPSMKIQSKANLQNNTVFGRPAFNLEFALVSKSGVRLSTMATMPDDIAIAIKELRSQIIPDNSVVGSYMWVKPFGASGQADIDLTQGVCNSDIEKTIVEALNTGRILSRLDLGAHEFNSGERANRFEFIAKTKSGAIRFGVIKH